MKTVDLNAILDKHTTGRINIIVACIDAMKEACEQAIELAAENSIQEDKQSILNTKNQIK